MGLQQDIFISYAHVNNQPLPGAEYGWVTTLITGLKVYLNQKFGRVEGYSLWMDYKLDGNKALTPEIIEKLQDSAVFLLILSPGYLASEWCMKELDAFLERHGANSSRIFVVEFDRIENKPAGLEDLKGYQFWYKDHAEKVRTMAIPEPRNDERDYYQTLDDLALQLNKQILDIRQRGNAHQQSPIIANSEVEAKKSIYISPVHEGLAQKRAELIRYLEQQKFTVVPASNHISFSNFQEEMQKQLEVCSHVVQLLDGYSNMGLPVEQYNIAIASTKPVIQWRSALLDLASVKDKSQLELLEKETVIASNMADFKGHLSDELVPDTRVEKPKHSKNSDAIVFVNAGQEDLELARRVSEKLAQKGFLCMLPLTPTQQTKPSDVRKDLEQNLVDCDFSLIIYAKSSPMQIRSLLKYSWRMNSKREQPLKTALCVPEEKVAAELNVNLPQMYTLSCHPPISEDCIEHFVEEII